MKKRFILTGFALLFGATMMAQTGSGQSLGDKDRIRKRDRTDAIAATSRDRVRDRIHSGDNLYGERWGTSRSAQARTTNMRKVRPGLMNSGARNINRHMPALRVRQNAGMCIRK